MSNKIHENVELGEDPKIGDYCIIGIPKEDQKTTIGNKAVIRSHTTIYAGNNIGDNFQTGHAVNIRENNNIGNNVSIGTKTIIEHHVNIEDNVRIHSGVFIPEFTILKEGCWIGPCVVITNAKYPKSQYTKDNLQGVEIGKKAKIGANTTILPGIKIGENSLVGAGSVVTKDLPDNVVAAGNPARIIRNIDEVKYKEGKAYE